MKPSSASAKTKHTKARNATLLNLLGTPGFGSLLAGKIVAGLGQLVLFLAGFVLFCIWAVVNIMDYSHLAFDATPPAPNQWGKRAVLGIVLCGVAWVWSLVTSLQLIKAAKQDDISALKNFAAAGVKLDAAKIPPTLATVPQWERKGDVITRTFEFKNFVVAMKFVNAVAGAAESAQHHPDVDIRWNKVTLAFTTHDAGGLTEKDFALARHCDALAAGIT